MLVRSFVCSFIRASFSRVEFVSKFCVKVSQVVYISLYLSNYLLESIHIWTIVTLEGWHSLHNPGPQGPCPGVGLEVKILDSFKSAFSKFCYGITIC